MYSNPFIKNNDEYKRDYNVVKKYINDSGFFIHKMKNIPLEESKNLVKKSISKEGSSPLNDPKVLMLERGDNGDKLQKESTFLNYIKTIQDSKDLCSPTMTTYLHPNNKESVIARFLEGRMKQRKEVKKKGHVAEMEKNDILASYCYNLQTAIKIIVNSVSGAHGSAGTPLYNHSSHPSLTSTCRCATSYANANNERFLEGMRHYWCYEVTQADIISIVANTDYDNLKIIMGEYSIVYPSVEDVMKIIARSTKAYWRDDEKFVKLLKLIESFTPLERAAYLYTQDCYSLFKFNNELVNNILLDFSKCPNEECEDPEYWMSQLDGDILMTVSLIASDFLDGRTLDKVMESDPVNYRKFANVVKHFIETRERYKPIIETFWRTDHIPVSIASYPSAIRKSVIVSDTDSTIFSVSNWVERVKGKLGFDKRSVSIATIMVYLASQTLKHVLAIYSSNMGVIPERIFQLTMKNEFMMESLMLTTKSKHYAYKVIAKEGNVYSVPSLDIKGKSLRDSKIPEFLRKELRKMIDNVLEDTKLGEGINVLKYLTRVGDLEREIKNKIIKGSPEYMLRVRVKDKASYRLPRSSNYFYYELWQNVFADKYGDIATLPVQTVKVSLPFTNKTHLKTWIENIEDRNIADRLTNFLKDYGRDKLSNILVPIEIASSGGIPIEIIEAAQMRKIIYSSMEGFYLVLESIGYFCQNRNNTRLIMDNY